MRRIHQNRQPRRDLRVPAGRLPGATLLLDRRRRADVATLYRFWRMAGLSSPGNIAMRFRELGFRSDIRVPILSEIELPNRVS